MKKLASIAKTKILFDKDELILKQDSGKFFFDNMGLSVKDVANKLNFPIIKDIEAIAQFEKDNEEYLNTPEGREAYTITKNLLLGQIFGEQL